jgi:hypothetical protein
MAESGYHPRTVHASQQGLPCGITLPVAVRPIRTGYPIPGQIGNRGNGNWGFPGLRPSGGQDRPKAAGQSVNKRACRTARRTAAALRRSVTRSLFEILPVFPAGVTVWLRVAEPIAPLDVRGPPSPTQPESVGGPLTRATRRPGRLRLCGEHGPLADSQRHCHTVAPLALPPVVPSHWQVWLSFRVANGNGRGPSPSGNRGKLSAVTPDSGF